MAQRLKNWESPRREGRNSKGKGGAARARQLKKQQQMMRKKLKGETQSNNQGGKRIPVLFPFCSPVAGGLLEGLAILRTAHKSVLGISCSPIF
jgi:hypothetical protein